MLGSFESKLVEDYVSELEKERFVTKVHGYHHSEEVVMTVMQKTPRQEIAEKHHFPKFFCTFEGGYLLDGHYLVIRAPNETEARGLMYNQFEYSWTAIYTEYQWINKTPQTIMKFLGEF